MSNPHFTFNLSSDVTNISIALGDDNNHPEKTRTIRSVLAQAWPPLEYPVVSKGKPAPLFSLHWVQVLPDDICTWNDFSLLALVDAFDNILQAPADLVQNPIRFMVNGVTSLKNLQTTFLAPLLQSSLDEGSRVLASQLGRTSLWALAISAEHDASVSIFQSSLAFFLETRPDATCLALGATRLAKTWSPHKVDRQGDWILPFRHIATLAVHSRTRYAFVFTDEEVVVCRVFTSDSERHPGCFGVEWQSVPLTASGTDNLTVALALWSLVMMGLNENHREVIPRSSLQPLKGWNESRDINGRPVYDHPVSNRRVYDLPSSGRVL